jgi:transcriptional regulator with XRE-family HTH domain
MSPVPGLKAIRERAGLSRESLARRSKVPTATIVVAEGGGGLFDTTIRDLARALGVTPEDLLGGAP